MMAKTTRRCLFMPDSLWREVGEAAKKQMMTRSVWIRLKLRDAVNRTR